MRISIGKNTENAMKILGIKQYPFTSEELKKCFKISAKKTHSDHGGSDKDFIKVSEAMLHLKNLAIDIEEQDNKEKSLDRNRKLGRFDKECSDCNGTGEIYHEEKKEFCFGCFGSGKHSNICRSCRGTGKFKQRSGAIVNCHSCKGTGIKVSKCIWCNGNGSTKEESFKTQCGSCKGKGIVTNIPFNPVVPENGILI